MVIVILLIIIMIINIAFLLFITKVVSYVHKHSVHMLGLMVSVITNIFRASVLANNNKQNNI